jgi:hypothetical protein
VGEGTFEIEEELKISGGMQVRSLQGPQKTTIVQTKRNRRAVCLLHGTVEGFTLHGAGCFEATLETDVDGTYGFAALIKSSSASKKAQMRDCIVEGFVSTKAYTSSTPSLRGGTVALLGGDAYLYASTISNNTVASSGGGLFLAEGGGLVRDCRIVGNRANGYHGGGVSFHGGARIVNSLIAGNSAPSAGGIWGNIWKGESALQNCTIVGNTATTEGNTAGLYLTFQLEGAVENCVFSANRTAAGVPADLSCAHNDPKWEFRSMTFRNCRLPAVFEKTNILFRDCLLGETAYDEKTYEPLSAPDVANRGVNAAWMETALDLAGRPRLHRARVDIGCFELPWTPGLQVIVE